MKQLDRRRSRVPNVVVAVLLLIGVVFAAAWLADRYNFNLDIQSQTEASVSIDAPDKATLLTPYSIKIAVSARDTANATLSLFLPEGFMLEESNPTFVESPSERERQWKLTAGDLVGAAPITIRGMFLGDLNTQKTFRAVLNYQPTNFESEFQTNVVHTVRIDDTPIEFSIDSPEHVKAGEEKAYKIKIKNGGSEILQNLTIVAPTEPSFAVTDEKEKLNIADLNVNTQLSRDINGSFTASTEGVITLQWTMDMVRDGQTYTIAAAQHTITIIQQPMLLTIALDNNPTTLSPDDLLKGTISYHNKTSQNIKNAGINLYIDAPSKKQKSMLDWDKLQTTGSPDIESAQINDTTRRGIILWDADDIPMLETIAPNQAGVLSFSIPIKASGNFDSTELGAIEIYLSAEMKNEDGDTVTAQPIAVPLVADTSINAGAIKAGETIVIQWTIEHHFHNLKNVKVFANLFGNIAWLNQADVSHGAIAYDTNRRLVEWNIPAFAATEGIATASFAVRLDKLDPTQTSLIGETTLTATDAIANRSITRRAEAVSMP